MLSRTSKLPGHTLLQNLNSETISPFAIFNARLQPSATASPVAFPTLAADAEVKAQWTKVRQMKVQLLVRGRCTRQRGMTVVVPISYGGGQRQC